jgi:hypothetical protein
MPLPKWELLNGNTAMCLSCNSRNTVYLYPAALAPSAAAHAEIAIAGEAACFDHPSNRAVAACVHCGRFVCRLCAVDFGAGVWCPSCLANSSAASTNIESGKARVLYDTWALVLPFGLLILWPLTILSAPAVIALTITKWKQPLSLVRRSRWRFVVGLAAALVQGGLWLWLIIYLMAKAGTGART